MHDFRDAKAMAQRLRHALQSRAVETTHSESLELIAKAFGYDNWNVLSAKIEAAERAVLAPEPDAPKPLHCSFCNKSQHSVRKLIAGPGVCICDKCVDACLDVIREESEFDKIFAPLKSDEGDAGPSRPHALELARGAHNEELAKYAKYSRKAAERSRFMLQAIERRLALRKGDDPMRDAILALPGLAFLQDKPRAELLALQRNSQNELKRYEEALHIVRAVLAERDEQSAGLDE